MVNRPVVIHHYIDVGDPQKDSKAARCSCGWIGRVSDAEEMTDWEYHIELMAMSAGHVYANAWHTGRLGDEESEN